MNQEVESYVQKNCTWSKLPQNVKQMLGGSYKEYDKTVINYSIRNQLRFKGNLVRLVMKDEEKYYEDLLEYSRTHLMLYPYHLSDVMVRGLRITPFQYYISMVDSIMVQERSYDALPNFTAADCLRLLGIGRNQYIDLMNQSRSGRKLFRRRTARELLPLKPVSKLTIEPWWIVHVGSITEEDIKAASDGEKRAIDFAIDNGPQKAGTINLADLQTLYGKGLIYLEVPIEATDHISVPPLEGFVMNRVLGDYFETLLYKIFVSVDEKTSVGELANVLQISVDQVKNAVSVYCRLGFARKKNCELDPGIVHSSWTDWLLSSSPQRTNAACTTNNTNSGQDQDDPLLAELTAALEELGSSVPCEAQPQSSAAATVDDTADVSGDSKRVAFLFDSSLTAFLMMGNLSPGLKSHAVTMFEVGKLSDESLDSLLAELDRISTDDSEGEAQRYFEHALTLRATVHFLRRDGDPSWATGLDLIRVESLQSLDPKTCNRLLRKNYHLLVAMAPLALDVAGGSLCGADDVDCLPPFWGPAIPHLASPWFKLYLYQLTGHGPATLLLARGERLRRLPDALARFDRILVTPWGHDSGFVHVSAALVMLNEALTHSPILIQGYGSRKGRQQDEKHYLAFPMADDESWSSNAAVQRTAEVLDLRNTCGFVTMVDSGCETIAPATTSSPTNGIKDELCAELLCKELDDLQDCVGGGSPLDSGWTVLNVDFGVPLFDSHLNRKVCDRIVERQLWRRDAISALTQTQKKLSADLVRFINDNVDGWARDKSQTVPLPTRNLFFCDGVLRTWNH